MQNYPIGETPEPNASLTEYQIIRCEDCHEIPLITFKMDKKEIQLKCEKEGKTKNIPFENFFATMKNYGDINCCQFCKNKNPSQKYYLCKTCSNKILCENCLNAHDKKDDIIKFNVDSICKKHYFPYESYCPICKENKCSYCSLDHEESHSRKEILLKKKIFKKNKLNEFKNTIKKIKNDKDKIDQKVKSVIKELEEKIVFINNLKNKFLEYLNMKLQFVELILNNYEKKLDNFDLNYFIINNLENQINFGLSEFNLNNYIPLSQKIDNTIDYLNKNINSQFNLDNKKNEDNEKSSTIWGNDVTDVDYKMVNDLKYDILGFFDFNKDLFAFYSSKSLFFISKTNFKEKFEIKESSLDEIKNCIKIDEEKILIRTDKSILIITIIDNSDYMITKNIEFTNKIYIFSSNFDYLCLEEEKVEENNKNITKYSFKSYPFPNYNKSKFSVDVESPSYGSKLIFSNNDVFFYNTGHNLNSYEIKNNNCSLKAKTKINIENLYPKIIDLNKKFYCLCDLKKVFLLNKEDMIIAKTININSNIGILKISDNLVSVFVVEKNVLYANNYDISSDGIKWSINNKKELLEKDASKFVQDKNYILFFKNSNEASLFKIEIKN